MEPTPFWQHFLVATIAGAFVAVLVAWQLVRRRRRPSQLGDILRRLSEEREAEAKRQLPPADRDLADADRR